MATPEDGDEVLTIYVDECGDMQMVYSDLLAGAFSDLDGEVKVSRASHVEPHPFGGGWIADMGPVDGPILCANGESLETGDTRWNLLAPFKTRAEALAAEVAWIGKKLEAGTLRLSE